MKVIFERQGLHVALLALLTAGLIGVSSVDAFHAGELWGTGSLTWAVLAAATAVAHQVWVWLFWRFELHGSLPSRALGPWGFRVYAAGFAVLGIGRTALVFILAVANQGTIAAPRAPMQLVAVVLAIPAIYLFYSVARYFGFVRALGADHFDPSYRSLPIVTEGIFRFTRNGMYTYGFLVFWVAAFWWSSFAAMGLALFNHAYIWVHFFSTERPDMRRIYG